MSIYFDLLPTELLYEICILLKSDSAFYNYPDERIKGQYLKYLHDLNRGFIGVSHKKLDDVVLYENGITCSTIPTNTEFKYGKSIIIKYLISNRLADKPHISFETNTNITIDTNDLNNSRFHSLLIEEIIFFTYCRGNLFIIFKDTYRHYVIIDESIDFDIDFGVEIYCNIGYYSDWKSMWDTINSRHKFEILVQNGYSKYLHLFNEYQNLLLSLEKEEWTLVPV